MYVYKKYASNFSQSLKNSVSSPLSELRVREWMKCRANASKLHGVWSLIFVGSLSLRDSEWLPGLCHTFYYNKNKNGKIKGV